MFIIMIEKSMFMSNFYGKIFKERALNNKMDYNELLQFFKKNIDIKKSEFDKKIINSNLKHYGIKTADLRKLAKKISYDDSFLLYPINDSYECDFIIGVSMAYSKKELKDKFVFYDEFFKNIDNWGIVDAVCSSLKIRDNDYFETFYFIKNIVNSKYEFLSRFGYILFLSNFVNKKYLDDLFSIINLNEKRYYVMMAQAWLLSTAYIKYPKETYNYLKNIAKDNKILKFSIQKVLDSLRVSNENKILIKRLR